MAEAGNYTLVPIGQHSNGPLGGYSPPSDGEAVGQMTSDEEL